MRFFDNKKIWKLIYISGALLLMEIGVLVFAIIRYEPPRTSTYEYNDKVNAHVVVTNTVVQRRLQSIGELATYEYTYSGDVLYEADRDWVILNFLTESTIEIDYFGRIKAGIEVGAIEVNVDEENRVIYLVMPMPTIISNEIETVDYSEDIAVFGEVAGDTANSLLDAAKDEELQSAIDEGLMDMASENAEQVIGDLLSVYSDYEILFIPYDQGRR